MTKTRCKRIRNWNHAETTFFFFFLQLWLDQTAFFPSLFSCILWEDNQVLTMYSEKHHTHTCSHTDTRVANWSCCSPARCHQPPPAGSGALHWEQMIKMQTWMCICVHTRTHKQGALCHYAASHCVCGLVRQVWGGSSNFCVILHELFTSVFLLQAYGVGGMRKRQELPAIEDRDKPYVCDSELDFNVFTLHVSILSLLVQEVNVCLCLCCSLRKAL